jgi:hypothetical protein
MESTKLGNRNKIIMRGNKMIETLDGINAIFAIFELYKRLTLIKLKKAEENAQGVVSTNKYIHATYKNPKKITKRGKVNGK